MIGSILIGAVFVPLGARHAMVSPSEFAFSAAVRSWEKETSSFAPMSVRKITGRRLSRIANSAARTLGQWIICRGDSVHTNVRANHKPRDVSVSLSRHQKQGAHKGALHMLLKQVGLSDQMSARNVEPMVRLKRRTKIIPRLSMFGGFADHVMFYGISMIQRVAVFLLQYESELRAEREAA